MQREYIGNMKQEILEGCFSYFVKVGLEKVTIKELSENTGISSGSIYYWFGNKDGILIESTKYGLKNIIEELFAYVISHLDNIQKLLNDFPKKILWYKDELRFIYQVTTSKQYGEEMRQFNNEQKYLFNKYTSKLTDYLKCSFNALNPYVNLVISSILDYVVWEDADKIRFELNCVYKSIKNVIDI